MRREYSGSPEGKVFLVDEFAGTRTVVKRCGYKFYSLFQINGESRGDSMLFLIIWGGGVLVTLASRYLVRDRALIEHNESPGAIFLDFLEEFFISIFWPIHGIYLGYDWLKTNTWAISENLAITVAVGAFLILRN